LISFLFAFMQIIGSAFHREETYPLTDPVHLEQIILLALILYPCVTFFWFFLSKRAKVNTHSEKHPWWLSLVFFILILAGWLPYWLGAFPGFFCYDATNQFIQVFYAVSPFNAHHPLLHTLLLGGLMDLGYQLSGDFNTGVIMLSWVEMVIGAAVFTYSLRFIHRITRSITVTLLALIFYACFPTIAIFSSCSTKDVLFSLMLLLFVLRFADLYVLKQDTGKRNIAGKFFLVIIIALMLLLKKNGACAFLAFLPLQFFIIKKDRWKRSLVLLNGFVLFVSVNYLLTVLLTPVPDSEAEMLSVPAQQIARVYTMEGEHAFTPEEWSLLGTIMYRGNLGQYKELVADVIKVAIKTDSLDKHRTEAIKMWIDVGLRYPQDYLNAFLVSTYQAWYPFTDITGYNSTGMNGYDTKTCYFACAVEGPAKLESILPGMYDFMWNISRAVSLYQIPVIGLLFTIGFMMWVFVYTFGYSIFTGNRGGLSILLFELLILLTNFLGPMTLVRYYLILFYMFPVCLGLLFYKRSSS